MACHQCMRHLAQYVQFVSALSLPPPQQAVRLRECTCSFLHYLAVVIRSPTFLCSCTVCTKKANRHFIVPVKHFKLIQVPTCASMRVIQLAVHADLTMTVVPCMRCSPGHSGYVVCQIAIYEKIKGKTHFLHSDICNNLKEISYCNMKH